MSNQDPAADVYDHYGGNLRAVLDLNQGPGGDGEKSPGGQDKGFRGWEGEQEVSPVDDMKEQSACGAVVDTEMSPQTELSQDELTGDQGKTEEA